MDDCCSDKAEELSKLQGRQKTILVWVLILNLIMFFVEGIYGLLVHSVSLLADSLDMLGDAFVYSISLFVIGRALKWNVTVSLVKGIIMTAFGIGILVSAVYKFIMPIVPEAQTMGIVATAALLANLICAALLLKHRNDDLNMQSTWLCSRNDVIANLGVIVAAVLVGYTESNLPDLIVGILIAIIVLKSSAYILMTSVKTLSKPQENGSSSI